MTRANIVCTFMMGVLAGLMMIVLAELTGASGINAAQATSSNQAALISTQGGTIRSVIDGEEKGRIDQDVLHVKGNINDAGMLWDTGIEGYSREATDAP